MVAEKQQVLNPIEKKQIQQIQCSFANHKVDRDERLQFMSDFFNREIESTKELTFIEADELIYFQRTGEKTKANWGFFDKNNKQHIKLLSQLRTAQWTVDNGKYGHVADLERLSDFLKSAKSPVNKPLKKMNAAEVSKVIFAFDGIIKSTFNK
jgi:hypothetical protein